jgi:hypothetical protein
MANLLSFVERTISSHTSANLPSSHAMVHSGSDTDSSVSEGSAPLSFDSESNLTKLAPQALVVIGTATPAFLRFLYDTHATGSRLSLWITKNLGCSSTVSVAGITWDSVEWHDMETGTVIKYKVGNGAQDLVDFETKVDFSSPTTSLS